MQGLGLRIKELREGQNMTKSALATIAGLSGQAISDIEEGISKDPRSQALLRIAEHFQVNLTWLLTGEAQPEHPQPKEYRQMKTSEVEDAIVRYANPDHTGPVVIEFKNGTEKKHELQTFPLYDITAAAGLNALHNSSQNILDYMSIPNLAKCDGAIYLKGDSMYPLLKHGDIVAFQRIVDIPDDIYFGEMYIVDLSTPGREKIVCKYVQKSELGNEYVKLVSYNEKHHPPKDVHIKKIRAMAEVKASIRLT